MCALSSPQRPIAVACRLNHKHNWDHLVRATVAVSDGLVPNHLPGMSFINREATVYNNSGPHTCPRAGGIEIEVVCPLCRVVQKSHSTTDPTSGRQGTWCHTSHPFWPCISPNLDQITIGWNHAANIPKTQSNKTARSRSQGVLLGFARLFVWIKTFI